MSTPNDDPSAPGPEELDALMRLLDDETPEVRRHVGSRLDACGGDLSEWLASWPGKLSPAEAEILRNLLGNTRRRMLEQEWLIPSGGASSFLEDPDAFEACLRLLSDFLHDGISVRQSLSDGLDLLAEDAESAGVSGERKLANHLFRGGPLHANEINPKDPSNLDLAWAIASGRSTPIGLGIIFILTASRLGMEVEGVNYPGHFLCRIHEEGIPLLIDCHDEACPHLQMTLLENPALTRAERAIIRTGMSPGEMLLLLMDELVRCLEGSGRNSDAKLVRKLRRAMV